MHEKMRTKLISNLHTLALASVCMLITSAFSVHAEILSEDLSVISSANPRSNSVQSFIIVPEGQLIAQGIKHKSRQQTIGPQTPFVIEYTKPLDNTETLQWNIKVSNKQYGTINLLSDFPGKGQLLNSGYTWKSNNLDKNIKARQRLVFRPKPFSHQPSIYKKGRGPSGKRRKYGGGTQLIDYQKYNPKFSYTVTLNIIKSGNISSTHKAILEMDRKDMIRQEYINHYDIKRYGRGNNGNIPIPTRNEISEIPKRPENIKGNPLTESKYRLIINDGMLELANKINQAYISHLEKLQQKPFYDLDSKLVYVPSLNLWITSGWRNPERNEWYSNAVNGIHQRGGAVDFIIMAPSNSRDSSIGYWALWQALEANKGKINAYWQLETNGRPMTTKEFEQDIEPRNGIPDAFDKADHLHANVNY